jgi:hypothetical protein
MVAGSNTTRSANGTSRNAPRPVKPNLAAGSPVILWMAVGRSITFSSRT